MDSQEKIKKITKEIGTMLKYLGGSSRLWDSSLSSYFLKDFIFIVALDGNLILHCYNESHHNGSPYGVMNVPFGELPKKFQRISLLNEIKDNLLSSCLEIEKRNIEREDRTALDARVKERTFKALGWST